MGGRYGGVCESAKAFRLVFVAVKRFMARARLPSVFVISIRRNQSRLARALASCAVHGVVVHVIDGIDADHDFHKLKSYRDMLGPDFWGGPEIKPGAFACFLSHRMAWDAFLRSGEERAIFIEDDGLLTSGRFAAPKSDLVFLNARMAAWSRAVGSTAAEDIVAALAVGFDPGARGLALGPGGDGYFMTRHGAMIASEHSRV
ncbi:MAG: glycosyltransferase family 25 protein, partial [Pseudomonadota bacterium]